MIGWELASVRGPEAAWAAGLITSLHCVGMCGPLACLLAPTREAAADTVVVTSVYQATRLLAYGLLGAAAGALGAQPLAWLSEDALRLLPWLLVVFYLAVALRVERWWTPGPGWGLQRLTRVLTGWSRRGGSLATAAAVGLGTPLLPCGPLYFLVALAALSGSALAGAELLLAFGLGTLPLLWLAQANYGRLLGWCPPRRLAMARSGLALVCALVLAWRLRASFGLPGPTVDQFLCH